MSEFFFDSTPAPQSPAVIIISVVTSLAASAFWLALIIWTCKRNSKRQALGEPPQYLCCCSWRTCACGCANAENKDDPDHVKLENGFDGYVQRCQNPGLVNSELHSEQQFLIDAPCLVDMFKGVRIINHQSP